jgi:hypothetical protein
MNWQVSWTPKQRELARTRDTALFGFGVSSKGHKTDRLGRAEVTGLMTDRTAARLFRFVQDLYAGRDPREAFEAEGWPGPEPEKEPS